MSIRFRDKTNHRDITLGGIPYLFSRTRAGLTPQAPSGSGTTKYLREDGTWVAPPDTTKGNSITTNAAKTGSGTTVTSTIAANTTMDNAIGTLLNNDVALNASLIKNQNIQKVGKPFALNDNLVIKLAYITEVFTSDSSTSYQTVNIAHHISDINSILAVSDLVINQYTLPYVSNGVVLTYVATVGKTNIVIMNRANWPYSGNYTLRGFIWYV